MRKFGLIGFPLSHSFSEKYFAEKFQKEKISDAEYRNYPLQDVLEFPSLLLQEPELLGLNVTIPHKEMIIPMLDSVDEEVLAIGAVNCIAIRNGKTKGYNTDAYGFEFSVKPFLENRFERALILGNGGASKAIKYVLHKWGIPTHTLARNPKDSTEGSFEDLSAESLRYFPLIIQTTPLGTFPTIETLPPIPYEGIGSKHLLIDLVYNPSTTAFMQKGIDAGAQVMNGLSMLKLQAEKSWEIWQRD